MLFSNLLLGLAVVAQQGPTTAPPATADQDKVVCRSESQTGSRLDSHRICMTRSQWAERQRNAQNDLKAMQANVPRCPKGQAC